MAYTHARKHSPSFESIRQSRLAAEAICRAVGSRLQGRAREEFDRKSELSAQIGILEAHAESIGLPAAVIPALQTLRAYGNYASHFNRDHVGAPPLEAAESAMASLSLLVSWTLGRDRVEAPPFPLVDPEPPRLRWLERRKIAKVVGPIQAQRDTADLKVDEVGKLRQQLLGRFDSDRAWMEPVVRFIVKRETTRDPADMPFEWAIAALKQVSRTRPWRVPVRIADKFEFLSRQRDQFLRAISSGEPLDARLFAHELDGDRGFRELLEWFDKDYLGKSLLERRGGRWLLLGVALWVGWQVLDSRSSNQTRHVLADLRDRHCRNGNADTPLCTELRRRAQPPPSAQTTTLFDASEAPSFDCAKATTADERRICGDGNLRRLDRELDQAYRSAFARTDERMKARLEEDQLVWLRARRACVEGEAALQPIEWQKRCLSEEYERRIARLKLAGD